ncbi:bifunctional 4-hydroxy-2-oxoglutarate aldolase/2-dehydro-3-deoxy-phosphogluconate aldolase [Georgenia halophila]|uniref:Bifunctional 4-hydroxy-2-oxoglutarate aldolase/2-dehydro-3-deoxy-phosphogluconate aldolase n=1 Tax=Georgenia halophila TaxID=620889 RepID=A0ABP8LMX2_9MICO
MPAASTPSGVIAIIRLREQRAVDEIFQALLDGGVRAVEVTADTPGAFEAVTRWRGKGSALVGVGTVRTPAMTRRAIDAGAEFLVTPTTMPEVLEIAGAAGVPVAAGALSPTEIDTAWHHGAAAVKVFPVDTVGGPAYIRAVQAPLSDVPLVPTGGVDASAARTYAGMGCVGVGVGSALVDERIVAAGDWSELQSRAAALAAAWSQGLAG